LGVSRLGGLFCIAGCASIQFWAYFGLQRGWWVCVFRLCIGLLLIAISFFFIHRGLDLTDPESSNHAVTGLLTILRLPSFQLMS
jgi:hypothetical protein